MPSRRDSNRFARRARRRRASRAPRRGACVRAAPRVARATIARRASTSADDDDDDRGVKKRRGMADATTTATTATATAGASAGVPGAKVRATARRAREEDRRRDARDRVDSRDERPVDVETTNDDDAAVRARERLTNDASDAYAIVHRGRRGARGRARDR